jgi:hypothetical protein
MKTDKTLFDRLDKFVLSLLDAATADTETVDADGKPLPPVELSERLKVLDSVGRYIATKNRISVDEDEGGGIGELVSQLRGAPKGRTRREPSSRRPTGPGIGDVPIRDRFGPDSPNGKTTVEQ